MTINYKEQEKKYLDLLIKYNNIFDKEGELYNIVNNTNYAIIQTGIGDILLVSLLLKHNLIPKPVYINLSGIIYNIYYINNSVDTFEFKLQLLDKLLQKEDVVFFNDETFYYTDDWQPKLKLINNWSLFHSYFDFTYRPVCQDYIVFHTKCRFLSEFNYEYLKHRLYHFCKHFKTKYTIVLLGEQILPFTSEIEHHKMTTIYNELLELKNNNNVVDLTTFNILDNLNFDNYCKDLSIVHNAKCNIIVGHGGHFCNTIVFGKQLISYLLPSMLNSFDIEIFKNNNIIIHYEMDDFFYNIEKEFLQDNIIVPIVKQKAAIFLSHNGLGDNITNIGAVRFLLNYYDTIFFLCKQQYQSNVNLLFNNNSVVTIPILATNETIEKQNCKNIIDNINSDDIDIFISGGAHTSYLKSKITHPDLLAYQQNDKGFTCDYSHIREFYYDIGLDFSIYFNYFDIPISNASLQYYQEIKQYNIVFLHTEASNRKINLDHVIQKYFNNDKYVIICANKNVYNSNHKYHSIAEKYVNIFVAYYVDIIKNSNIIQIIDSCFSCIVYPLMKKKMLLASEINIISR